MMHKRRWLPLVLVVAGIAHASAAWGAKLARPAPKPAAPSEFHYVGDGDVYRNYVAFIATVQGSYYYFCAGSIIDRRFLLTAAHCVSPRTSATTVYFGVDMRRFQRGAKGIKVADVRINPRYFDDKSARDKISYWWQDQHDADLAVIKLASDVPPDYKPVQLDYLTTHQADGHFSRVISGFSLGYGDIVTPAGKKKLDPRLKRKDLKGLRVFEYSNIVLVIPDKAAYSVCSGDSGGPVILDDGAGTLRQIAVNSRADVKCQGTSAPAPIADSYDWIRDAMIAMKAPNPLPARPDDAGNCVERTSVAKTIDGSPGVEVSIVNKCTVAVRCTDSGWYRSGSRPRTLFKDPVDLKPGEVYAKALTGVKSTADEAGLAECSRVEAREEAVSKAGP